ncbi:hypothetical protein AGDE_04055 [Angomonas deanei]|nr:hypothetical protein AGDE_04055 [Angomonas deanei]|eukprot:EPY39873.1 hypothetical protein AGDE_04055 [Angomonas deanei]
MANVVTLSVFLGAMMYAKSPEITRSVARGVIPPLKLSRLKALPFPISTICGSEGDRTLKDFLLYVAAFPGVTVGVVMYIMCIVVTGDLSFHWSVPTQTYLAMTSLWRLVVAASIFTMNYIAALNPSQTIFIPTPDSDAVQETAKTK